MFYEDTIAVVAGTSLYKNTSVFYSDVLLIRIYDDFDALTLENDIALLYLSKKVSNLMLNINLVTLAGNIYPIDTNCSIAGWGLYTDEV